MNINEYKKYLKSVHNTLDDPSMNNQMRDRLSESPVCDMKEYKPDTTKDKSSHKPTTAAGDSLRPHSKKSDAPKKLKEDEDVEVEIPECVQQYFENCFGDNLNEDTSDEDIIKAVEDLVDLCEAVCDAVGIDEAFPRVASFKKGDTFRYPGPSEPSLGPDGKGSYGMTPVSHKGYIKPSPEQLKTALAKQADNSPLVVTRGRDTFEGKPYTKAIRPSDVRDAARAKRMKKMKKFKM
jgi:hypothetical protein